MGGAIAARTRRCRINLGAVILPLHDPVKIADTVVPAGEYKVLHTMDGDNHIMVFQQQNVSKKNQANVKIKCNLKPLDKAADQNLIGYKKEGASRVLSFLQFKCDKAVHQV